MPPKYAKAPIIFDSKATDERYVPIDEMFVERVRLRGQRVATVNAYCEWLEQKGADFEVRYTENNDMYYVKSNIAEGYVNARKDESKIEPPKRNGGIKRRTALSRDT